MKRAAALIVVLCVALYAPSAERFFVSDDFINVERSRIETLADAMGLFSTEHVDFYRPLPRLHFALLDGFVGDQMIIWNLVGVGLHIVASWLAAMLIESLLGRRKQRVARWAAVFFSVHFVHVEPVVWASGVTSLYVAIFVFAALLGFRQARRTGSLSSRVVSVIAFALALQSKETAVVFLPLLFFTTWYWPLRRGDTSRLPRVGELAPYGVLLVAYAFLSSSIDRGGAASPYQFTLGAHLLKNLLFFGLGGFVPVRYWQLRDAWADSGGDFAGVAFDAMTNPWVGPGLVLGALAVAAFALRGGRDSRGGLLWIAVSALPFLFLPGSGERFLYLPSLGACIVFGLVARRLLTLRIKRGRMLGRASVLALLAMHVAGNIDRQADWIKVSQWSRSIVNRWGYLEPRDPETPIEFHRVAGHYRSAWLFRNGFDAMVRLYWDGRNYYRVEDRPHQPGADPERLGVALSLNGTLGLMPIRFLPPLERVPSDLR